MPTDINVIRSVRSEIIPGGRVLRSSGDSPIIDYLDKRYHYGASAYDYQSHTAIANDDKLEPSVFIPTLLATLAPFGGQSEYTIDLHWILPNPSVPSRHVVGQPIGEYLREQLNGTFDFTRNGLGMSVKVFPQEPQYEGLAPVLAARKQSLIPSTGNTICIDIGGGTWNVLVVNQQGDIIDQASKDKAGGVRLASLIADNYIVKSRLGDELELERIMDGLANRSNCYCGNPRVHWNDVLGQSIEQWFSEGKGWTFTRFKQHMANTTMIMFIGGNANLLEPRIKGKQGFFIYPNPETANVTAMRYMAMAT
ncbi:ParM/StbA family protein [Mastigocladus laminosus UU774]|nr:ParM/StbA family protein [Mastigocladus laminosus UU774]